MLLKALFFGFGLSFELQSVTAQECVPSVLTDYTATVSSGGLSGPVYSRYGTEENSVFVTEDVAHTFTFKFDVPEDTKVYVKDDAGQFVEAMEYFETKDITGLDMFNVKHYSQSSQEWSLIDMDVFADPKVEAGTFTSELYDGVTENGKIAPTSDGFMVIELKERTFYDSSLRELLPIPIMSITTSFDTNTETNAERERVMNYHVGCTAWAELIESSSQVELVCPQPSALNFGVGNLPNINTDTTESTSISRPQPIRLFGEVSNYVPGNTVEIDYTMGGPGFYILDTLDVPVITGGVAYEIRSFEPIDTRIAYSPQGFEISWISTDEEGAPIESFKEETFDFRYPDLVNGESGACDSCDCNHPISPLSPQIIREPRPFTSFKQVVPDVLHAEAYENYEYSSNSAFALVPILRPNYTTYLARADAFSSIRDNICIIGTNLDTFMVRNTSALYTGCGEIDYVPPVEGMCTVTDDCLARLDSNALVTTSAFFGHPEYKKLYDDFASNSTKRSMEYELANGEFSTRHVPDLTGVEGHTGVTSLYGTEAFEILEPFLYYNQTEWETQDNSVLLEQACSQVVWEPSLVPYEEDKGKLVLTNVTNAGTGKALVTITVNCTGDNIVTPPASTYTVSEYKPLERLEIELRVTGIANSTTSECSVTMTLEEKPLWVSSGKTVNCPDIATIPTYFGLFTHPCDLVRPKPVLDIIPTKTSYMILRNIPTKVLEVDVTNNGTDAIIRTTSNSTRCVYGTGNETGSSTTESNFVANASSTVTQNTHILTGDDPACDINFDWQKHEFCQRFETVGSLSLILANSDLADEDTELGIGMAAGLSAAVGISIVFAALAVYLLYRKTRGSMGARGSYLSLSGFTHESMLAPEEMVLLSADGQYRKLTQFTATRHSELCLLHANDQEVIVFGTILGKTGDSRDIVIDDIREIFLDRENDDVWIETERCMYFLDKPQAEYNIFFSSLKTDLKVLMDAQAAGN